MNIQAASTTTTTSTAARPQAAGRLRRRIAGLLITAGMAAGLAVAAGSGTASAASPGVFNYTQCMPSSRTIVQDIEAYRSYAGEYVMLQAALVNTATRVASYSQWAVGTGATAHAAIGWSNVARGEYNVFYRWASWNTSTRQYVYSSWIQVTGAGLNTYGNETYPGSRVFIGGFTGRCVI